MSLIEKEEVRELLDDQKFITELVENVVKDPDVMDELAEEVADELVNILEKDAAFKQKLVTAALSSKEFKDRVIKEVSKEIGD
jgi:hypothetical protein